MVVPVARPRQVSDDDIVDVARTVFLQHGPAASTSLIADQLGISQAALFKRYGTKEELMRAALLPGGDPPFVALMARGPDDRPIEAQLVEMVSAMTAWFDRFVPCFAVLKAAGVDFHAEFARHPVPPPVQNHRLLVGWLSQANATGRIRAVDCEALASMVLGAVNGRAFLSHLGQPPCGPAERYVEAVVSVLWKGIRPEENPS